MGRSAAAAMDEYGATFARWRSLPDMFFAKADELGDKPLFGEKREGAWRRMSWAEARERVERLAGALRDHGVETGDRVLLLSENRPEWAIADLAIMSARALSVPAYTTNTVDDHLHLLRDSGAKLAIVSTPKLAERFVAAARAGGDIRTIIHMEEAPAPARGERIAHVALGEALASSTVSRQDIRDLAGAARRTDTACLIYTSGTGGNPKGVMLSHGAILCNCMGAWYLFHESKLADLNRDVFLSFLPLSHSYEHTAGLYFPLSTGAEIYYAESAEKLLANMGEVRPTIMTAVPRLYESMHRRIMQTVERDGGLKARLFLSAVALGVRRYEKGDLGLGARIADFALDRLVRAKFAKRLGGRLKAFVSGGAPLNYDIGVFFHALGVRLLQGYGQTETAPVVSCNPPKRIRIHTVGPPLRGVAVKFAEDGEILVSGELVMQGYWNNPEGTAAALRDGWVRTGDIGRIDEEGYIQITDRKRDIIVNSGGDNISPQRIEGMLSFEPELGQAMVYGDAHPYLVAVIVPDVTFLSNWAEAHGRDADLVTLRADAGLYSALQKVVDRVNTRVSAIEKIRRFIVAREAFTTENSLMTPSLKIRRHLISDLYRAELEALYARGGAA